MSPGARGFTLVEVMYASAVFLFGLIGVLTLDIAAQNQLASAEHGHRALLLANNQLAVTQMMPLTQITSPTPLGTVYFDVTGQPSAQSSAQQPFYTLNATLLPPQTTMTNLVAINVVVTWTEPSNQLARNVSVQDWAFTP